MGEQESCATSQLCTWQEGALLSQQHAANGPFSLGGGGWFQGCTLGHTHCDPKHALNQGMCLNSARSGQTEEETHP